MPQHHFNFVEEYKDLVGFGLDRRTNEFTLTYYLQKFAEDEHMALIREKMADEDLAAVTLGRDGAFRTMAPGSVFIDHTTVSARIARQLAVEAKGSGVMVVDAPVTGGQICPASLSPRCGMWPLVGKRSERKSLIRTVRMMNGRLSRIKPMSQPSTPANCSL